MQVKKCRELAYISSIAAMFSNRFQEYTVLLISSYLAKVKHELSCDLISHESFYISVILKLNAVGVIQACLRNNSLILRGDDKHQNSLYRCVFC